MHFDINSFLEAWGDMRCNFTHPRSYPRKVFTVLAEAETPQEAYTALHQILGNIHYSDYHVSAAEIARTVVAVTAGNPESAHEWLKLLAEPFIKSSKSEFFYPTDPICFGVVLGLFQAVAMLDEKDYAREIALQVEFPEVMTKIILTQLQPSGGYRHLSLSAQELCKFRPRDVHKGEELAVALSRSVKAYAGCGQHNREKRLAQVQWMVSKILEHIKTVEGIPSGPDTSWVGREIVENLSYGLFSLVLEPNDRLTTMRQFLADGRSDFPTT